MRAQRTFLEGLAVVAVTLAAGLVALWASQQDLGRLLQSQLVDGQTSISTNPVSNSGDIWGTVHTCTLSANTTQGIDKTSYSVHTTRADGAISSYTYLWTGCDGGSGASCFPPDADGDGVRNWPVGDWPVSATITHVDGYDTPNLYCGEITVRVAADGTKRAPAQPASVSVTTNTSGCTGGGSQPISCTGTNSPTLTWTFPKSTDDGNPDYDCPVGYFGYGVMLVRWEGDPLRAVEVINQGWASNGASTQSFTANLTALPNAVYHTSALAYCGADGYPFGTPTPGPDVGISYDASPPPTITDWSCDRGTDFTLLNGETASCTVHTANMGSSHFLTVGKSGGDCFFTTNRAPTAAEIASQSITMNLTAGSPSCFGPYPTSHYISSWLYDAGQVVATSPNPLKILIPEQIETCDPNGSCSAAQANTVVCGLPANQLTPWSSCQQQGSLYCAIPAEACNPSQYCRDGATPSTYVNACDTIAFGATIDSSTTRIVTTGENKKIVGAVNIGAWNANPHGYVKCTRVDYIAYDASGAELETSGTAVNSDTTFTGEFPVPATTASVRLSVRPYWAKDAGACTYANVKDNFSTALAQNLVNAAGGWDTRDITAEGSDPSLQVTCSGSYEDGSLLATTVLNDPTRTANRAEAWIDGKLVGWGDRVSGGDGITLTMYFTQADFPLATTQPNLKSAYFRLMNGTTLVKDQAGFCTMDVQNRIAWDVRVDSGITCSTDSTNPVRLDPDRDYPLTVTFSTGNPTTTQTLRQVQTFLYTDASGTIGETQLGAPATVGVTTPDGFAKVYSDVPLRTPASSGGATRALKVWGYAGSSAPGTRVDFRMCYVTIQDAAAQISAANSTITVGSNDCSTGTPRKVVTVTVRDSANALVSGATVSLANLRTGLSVTPASATSNTSGVATFTLSGAAGSYAAPAFVAQMSKTGNGSASKDGPAVTLDSCGGGGPTPVCGDGVCNGTENCSTCPGDCGTCPSTCQNPGTASLDPTSASVIASGTSQFTVTASGVTWTISASSGTVSPASGNGNATVTYTAPAASGTATLTLNATPSDTACSALTRTATVTITAVQSFVCTGTTPANATLCAGDDQNLTADTPRVLVDACTAAKCEYTCNAGLTLVNGQCAPNPVENLACPANQIGQTNFTASWTASPAATHYVYQVRQGTTVVRPNTETTQVSATITGLTAGTSYVFAVSPRTAAGLQGPERTVTCTTTFALVPRQTLTANPTTQTADGTSTATLTAQLLDYPTLSGQTGMGGYTITFTKADGSQATLLQTSAVTNAQGVATVTVRAPSAENVSVFTSTEATRNTADSATITYTPVGGGSGLTITLLLPLEGRSSAGGAAGQRGTHATSSMFVKVFAEGQPDAPIYMAQNQTTSAQGLLTHSSDTQVPNGTALHVQMKTGQHLARRVIGTVQNGVLSIDLGNPATFQELPTARQKGKHFLPAGDISGSSSEFGAVLHDNKADALDIAAFVNAFRKQRAGTLDDDARLADLDGNGSIGAEDLSLIIRNFGVSGDTLDMTTANS